MSKFLNALADVFDKLAEEEEAKPDESEDEKKKPASKAKSKDSDEEDTSDGDNDESDTKKQAARAYHTITGKNASDTTVEKIASDPDLFEALLSSVETNRTPARLGGPSTKKAQAESVPLTKDERRAEAYRRYGDAIMGERD